MTNFPRYARIGFGVFILAASSLVGCRESGPPPIQESEFVATWRENREEQSPRFNTPAPPTKNVRQLTLNADKTFKLEMVTPDGKPLSKPETVEGKWAFDKGTVTFTVEKSTLNERYKDWAPVQAVGIGQTFEAVPTISPEHADGVMATYVKVQ